LRYNGLNCVSVRHFYKPQILDSWMWLDYLGITLNLGGSNRALGGFNVKFTKSKFKMIFIKFVGQNEKHD